MRGQQPHSEVRLADPAPGVDPWPQRKTEIAARWRLHQPRGFREGRKPDVLPRAHDPQALCDEGPVERLQPRHVRHRAERDEVEQVDDLGFGQRLEKAALPSSRSNATPSRNAIPTAARWPCAAPILAFVEPVGIDQRVRDGQQGRALVMVDDDHVEFCRAGLLQRLEGLGSAVDAHDDVRAAVLQFDQGLPGRAIALHQPVGDVDHGIGTKPPQQQHQHRRARRAVDIIVAEDRNRLLLLDGIGEALRTLVHVAEAGRVGQEVADLGLPVALQVVTRHAPRKQQFVDQRVHADRRIGRPSPAPRLAGDRLFDVHREAHAGSDSICSRNWRAVALGIAGIISPAIAPPATPNFRFAVPNRRDTKFSRDVGALDAGERQHQKPPAPPARTNQQPIAVQRISGPLPREPAEAHGAGQSEGEADGGGRIDERLDSQRQQSGEIASANAPT